MTTVSDRPWADYTQADYTPAAWARACLIDTGQCAPDSKSRYKLPVREPDGTISRSGVHAAAARINQVDAPRHVVTAAARKLLSLYQVLQEDPPESLVAMASRSQFGAGILYRSAALTGGDGRTVYGKVIPFDQIGDVIDGGGMYQERFEYGAFTRSIQERGSKLKLFVAHDVRRLPIGRATELHERPDGVHAAFQIAESRDGNDALALVRSGVADAFSIGFKPIRERYESGVVVRTEAALMEVSLVGMPVYEGATVAGIRSTPDQPLIPKSVAAARLRLLNK